MNMETAQQNQSSKDSNIYNVITERYQTSTVDKFSYPTEHATIIDTSGTSFEIFREIDRIITSERQNRH